MPEERHLHVDMTAWIERYLLTAEGRALELTAFQRQLLAAVMRGERIVLISPRAPGLAQVMEVFRCSAALAGVEVFEVSSMPTRPRLAGE